MTKCCMASLTCFPPKACLPASSSPILGSPSKSLINTLPGQSGSLFMPGLPLRIRDAFTFSGPVEMGVTQQSQSQGTGVWS